MFIPEDHPRKSVFNTKKVKVLTGNEKMLTTVAITADSCDPVALWWGQLIDHNIGLILQVGCSQHSKWKDKTLDNVRQSYYWLWARKGIRKWCHYCDTQAASCGVRTKDQGSIQEVTMNTVRLFSQTNEGNQHLVTVMDYFTKWLKASTVPSQETSMVVEALVTNFFFCFRVL